MVWSTYPLRGIIRYIEKHRYRPPDEFIAAAIEAPLPSSIEYFEVLGSAGLLEGSPQREFDRFRSILKEIEMEKKRPVEGAS